MWVRLSDLCQGGFGIVGMPEYVRIALMKGEQFVKQPTTSRPPTFEWYLGELQNKKYRRQLFYPTDAIQHLRRYADLFRPAFEARITVNDLEVDTNYCTMDCVHELPVRLCTEVPVVWTAGGKYKALNLFQFLYHEKTALLQDPQIIWQCALDKLCIGEARFATLVQLMGMAAELKFQNPPSHVVENIHRRKGLSFRQLANRTKRFPQVVNYFIRKTEHLMA